MFWLSDVFTSTDSARLMRHYEARARAARTKATRRTLAAVGHTFAWIGAAATRGVVSRIRSAIKRRELIQALDHLDDHLLHDIGLTRDDVVRLNRGEWPTRIADEREKQATRMAMGTHVDSAAERGGHRQERRWREAA